MKSKLVLWGSNDQDEKLMIAVALRMDENKVDIWTFPESVATEDFYQKMMKEWRDGAGLEFPEPNTHIERELSMSESILPDEIKVERGDVVQRAQTEWHFLVLSSKLHQSYEDRCEELKASVEKLEKYDQGIWDSLKEFWGKVQGQVRERNLLREHADKLRDNINALFAKMKELRSKMDEEFGQFSKEGHDKLMAALDEIEKKVNEGARLPVMFDELKKLQHRFRETKMTREHRSKVWEKLDATFKDVKRRRFGDRASSESGSSPYQRTKRRYDGLISAIGKMQASIKRDKNDLDFQKRRIANTDGQLEAQIRQAKIKMIEERVRSKEEKLNEMNATKIDLEKRMASQKEKEERRAAQQAAKDKIAEKIKADAAARKADGEKLGKAAEKITAGKAKKEESIIEAVGATVGESLVNVMDTIKAASVVIGGKIGEAIDELKEEAGEAIAEAKEKAQEMAAELKEEVAEAKEKAAEMVEEAKEEISEKTEKAKTTAKLSAAKSRTKSGKAASKAKAKATEVVEDAKAKVAETKEKAAEMAEEEKEKISDEEE
ncbi:MAG TPA: hypothetical protein ENJ95_18400 [Bacteroidetes bacterium]|nr:hypothetical protein [Bacteroidota bacterium]